MADTLRILVQAAVFALMLVVGFDGTLGSLRQWVLCPSTRSCPADAWEGVFMTLSPCFRPWAGERTSEGRENTTCGRS